MRFLPALFILITIIAQGCLNNSVEITGKLNNPVEGEYLFLDELKSDELITVDSVVISEDGTFKLKLETKEPAFYLLKISESNFLTMLLEPGENLKIEAHHDSLNYPVSISGSEGSELMAGYNKKLRETIDKLSGLNAIYMQNQESADLPKVIESLDSLAQSYLAELNAFTKNYIDQNLSSLVSLVALYQQVAPNVYVLNPANDLSYYIKVDSSLSLNYPDYEPVKSLHEQVKEFMGQSGQAEVATQASGTGAVAPEIALPTPEGDTIALSSTRGSIVLLDFWAAWCAPCRQENPNLVKAYNLYNKKGFQIYQVSLDKTKENWVQGIQDDHLEKWIHVSDVKYWNSMVVPLYKIESIPANFLLDRDGRIIASNLRGEMLQIKLAELFGK
jgi:peroxiredoxin